MNFPSSSFSKFESASNSNILIKIFWKIFTKSSSSSILAERADQPELDSDRPKYCFFLTLFSRFDHNDACKKLTAKPQNGKIVAKQNYRPRKF
jgi:hypothetical protein